MKKYFINILALATFVALASCSEIEPIIPAEPENQNTPSEYILRAYFDADASPATKTALASNGRSIEWCTGDKIKLVGYGSGHDPYYALFESGEASINPENPGSATFSFPNTGDYTPNWAISPASAVKSVSGNYVHYEYPTDQTATENGFDPAANLAFGQIVTDGNGNHSIGFQNMGALLSVLVKDDDITSITIYSDRGLSGGFMKDIDGTFISGDGAEDYVTLSGTFVKDSYYYFVVSPGNYSGFWLQFTRSDGAVATFKSDDRLSLDSNDNVLLFKSEIPAWKWVTTSAVEEYRDITSAAMKLPFYFTGADSSLPQETPSENNEISYMYEGELPLPFYFTNNNGGVYQPLAPGQYQGTWLYANAGEYIGLPNISTLLGENVKIAAVGFYGGIYQNEVFYPYCDSPDSIDFVTGIPSDSSPDPQSLTRSCLDFSESVIYLLDRDAAPVSDVYDCFIKVGSPLRISIMDVYYYPVLADTGGE